MDSPSSISTATNDWVYRLTPSDDIIISTSKDDMNKIDFGFSTITGDIGFPKSSNIDIQGRIFCLKYDRYIKDRGDEITEVIPVPKINIRCKKEGFYTFVVGRYKQYSSIHADSKFDFNGSDIDPAYSYTSKNWYTTQWVYQLHLKPGDVFGIKHVGGTFKDFYENTHSWEDDTICAYRSKNAGGMQGYYHLGVTAWRYELSYGDNSKIIFTPVNKSSDFEVYS